MAWSVTVGTITQSDGTSLAASLPSGVVAGDLLVLCETRELGSVNDPVTGWTLIARVNTTSAHSSANMWYRIADGTAADTPTISSAASQSQQAVMLRITGHTAIPFDVHDVTGLGDGTTGSTLSVPPLTVAENGSLIVACGVSRTETITATWPASWTERADNGTTGLTRNHSMHVATREVTSGSYAGETVTLSGSDDRRCLVAAVFKPAAGGGISIPVVMHHRRMMGVS